MSCAAPENSATPGSMPGRMPPGASLAVFVLNVKGNASPTSPGRALIDAIGGLGVDDHQFTIFPGVFGETATSYLLGEGGKGFYDGVRVTGQTKEVLVGLWFNPLVDPGVIDDVYSLACYKLASMSMSFSVIFEGDHVVKMMKEHCWARIWLEKLEDESDEAASAAELDQTEKGTTDLCILNDLDSADPLDRRLVQDGVREFIFLDRRLGADHWKGNVLPDGYVLPDIAVLPNVEDFLSDDPDDENPLPFLEELLD